MQPLTLLFENIGNTSHSKDKNQRMFGRMFLLQAGTDQVWNDILQKKC